jgi:Flp pilus assembly protein TadD, contains TPR repeats
MAYKSDYDFVGNYDYGVEAGLLHVADHRVSPGKKQWTWGNGDFGRAWDRNLTDEDGPYIELMTGVFTDNQPDFAWLAPHEEKSFLQSFMPYKRIGAVKNATKDLAIALDTIEGEAKAGVYVSSRQQGLKIELRSGGEIVVAESCDLDPANPWLRELSLDGRRGDLELEVMSAEGRSLISYKLEAEHALVEDLPEAAKPIPRAEELPDAESLWLAARHLEQYRHATFSAEDYYLDGLRRFPSDIRLNTSYAELLLRRGLVLDAVPRLETAVATLTRYNANPADAEPLFYLAETHRRLGKLREAEDEYGKAAWSAPWQGAAHFELGRLCLRRGDYDEAASHARLALDRQARDPRARHILAMALRLAGKAEKARELVRITLLDDPLDAAALHEAALLGMIPESVLLPALGEGRLNLELVAEAYADAGQYEEAARIVESALSSGNRDGDPILRYMQGYWLGLSGDESGRDRCYAEGAQRGPDRVFPSRAIEEEVLRDVVARSQSDAKARYYLGNLYYDKGRYDEAIALWEACRDMSPNFPTARRNLAIAYYNKRHDKSAALAQLQAAFELDSGDARVLLELDQLKKKLGTPPRDRLTFLETYGPTAKKRDDLCAEFIVALNSCGRFEEALAACLGRRFHPWEGGEGTVSRQYAEALIGLGLAALRKGETDEAASLFARAARLPESLGEGKLAGARDNDIDYFAGLAAADAGNKKEAAQLLRRAAEGPTEPASFMFYNDQPPEKIFYQGLALRALGDESGARARFNRLVDYGERHRGDRVKIDYFAVSLPDFLIFDEDLDKRNRVHCDFLIGLGEFGLGDEETALARWESALREDPSHQGANLHVMRARSGDLGRRAARGEGRAR